MNGPDRAQLGNNCNTQGTYVPDDDSTVNCHWRFPESAVEVVEDLFLDEEAILHHSPQRWSVPMVWTVRHMPLKNRIIKYKSFLKLKDLLNINTSLKYTELRTF